MSPLKVVRDLRISIILKALPVRVGLTAHDQEGGPLADHGWHWPKPSAMFVTGLSSGLCTYFRACKVAMFFGCFIGFTPTS